LASVGESGRNATTTFVPCDVVRWQEVRVVVERPAGREEVERLVQLRVSEARAACGGRAVIYTVVLAGGGVPRDLRAETGRRELAAALRRQDAQADPPQWCAGVRVEPDAAALAAALEEETLLGEYLRAAWALLEQGETGPSDVWNVAAELPPEARELAGLVTPGERARREHLLREAAVLGLSALTAEEPME
jgi:hypothetical protein